MALNEVEDWLQAQQGDALEGVETPLAHPHHLASCVECRVEEETGLEKLIRRIEGQNNMEVATHPGPAERLERRLLGIVHARVCDMEITDWGRPGG